MCTLDGKTVDAAEKNTIVSSYAPANVNPQGGGGRPGIPRGFGHMDRLRAV